jgi:tRNA(Ile)-lysidine synthase
MHPLLKKTRDLLIRERLIAPGDKVVVGVSAGVDSMAMLQVLARLRAELSFTPMACYVNHGLRPAEAEKEAGLVEQTAAELGIPCRSVPVGVEAEARRQKISIEHAARLLRYQVFEAWAEETGAARIAVAHTANDQAEEVLIRLIRGSGRAGLAGMRTLRDGRIIRPFLQVTRDEVLAFLKEMQLSWLEDSSNQERQYLRNRVRLDLIPYLAAEFNPGIRNTLVRTAAILREEEHLLSSLARRAGERILSRTAAAGQPVACISLSPFRVETRAIQRRIVEMALLEQQHAPSFREIEQVLSLAERGKAGSRLHLRSGLRVVRSNSNLIVLYPQGRIARRGDLFSRAETAFAVTVREPGVYSVPGLAREVCIELLARVPTESELHLGAADYLDADRLPFPLCIRSPLPGDRFQPLGGSRPRKMGDFLARCRVPREKRWQVPVVVSAVEEIVAILGVRIGQAARLTPHTRSVLKFSLNGENVFTGRPGHGI